MEANKLAYTSYEPSWKEVLYTDVSGPSTPSGSFEPETASVTNLVTLAPCSSPAVLKSYLTTILQPYGIAISIFKHLTPGDAFRWMLASKDMMEVLSRDPKLIQLMLDKHCIRRPAPRLMAPCEWCSCFGCECAGCFTWDHNGYVCSLEWTPEVDQHSVLTGSRVNLMQFHMSRIRINGYAHFVQPARKSCQNLCSMGDVFVTPRI